MGEGEEGIESIQASLKWGKLNPKVITYLDEAQIIEMTGWTPEQIESIERERLRAYKIIWSAKPTATRREQKELKGLG